MFSKDCYHFSQVGDNFSHLEDRRGEIGRSSKTIATFNMKLLCDYLIPLACSALCVASQPTSNASEELGFQPVESTDPIALNASDAATVAELENVHITM